MRHADGPGGKVSFHHEICQINRVSTDYVARARWKATLEGKNVIGSLRVAAKEITGENPCASGLRSLCWKVRYQLQGYLGVENLTRGPLPDLSSLSNSRHVKMVKDTNGLEKRIFVTQRTLHEWFERSGRPVSRRPSVRQ